MQRPGELQKPVKAGALRKDGIVCRCPAYPCNLHPYGQPAHPVPQPKGDDGRQ